LSPAEFARAWEAGRALSPAEAATEALALAADLAGEGHVEAPPDALAEAMVALAGTSHPPGIEAPSAAAALGLTPREREVLRLLADGLSDREIAAELFLSPRTVGWHVTHLLAKLGVPSRAAAAATAIRRGLV
jgi:DNA-binding NarL/FixJ family response regulator